MEDEVIIESGGIETTEHFFVQVTRVLPTEIINHLPNATLTGEDHATSLESGEILRVHFEFEELLTCTSEIHSTIGLSKTLLFVIEDGLEIVENE